MEVGKRQTSFVEREISADVTLVDYTLNRTQLTALTSERIFVKVRNNAVAIRSPGTSQTGNDFNNLVLDLEIYAQKSRLGISFF